MPLKREVRSFSKKYLNAVYEALVTCCFLGRVPNIPGTAGTLGGVLLVILLPASSWFPLWALTSILLCLLIGATLTPWAQKFYGTPDPQPFVLDEVVGYIVAVLPKAPTWTVGILAFFLFRFFDVWKPYPARQLEKLPSWRGIFLDDLVAGIYACAVINVLRFFFPEL